MKNKTLNSSNYWFNRVVKNSTNLSNKELEEHIMQSLKTEIPSLLSVVFERTCNLNCQHCFYPIDKSSKLISEKVKLEEAVLNMVKQVPEKSIIGETPQFLHSGRILSKKDIKTMAKIKKIRSDIKIGMINNGSYVAYMDEFKKQNLLLDWLDVSLDGARDAHNKQRLSKCGNAFDMTINGLQNAREVIKPGGYVASLFTLTKLNYSDIENTADVLFSQNPKSKINTLADIMAITTMTPTNGKNEKIEASDNFIKDNSEFKTAWQQIKNATKKHGADKIIVHVYRHEDIEKIAMAVGEKKFMEAIGNNDVEIGLHAITFKIDGIAVHFSPFSTWAKEEMIVDADAVARTALSGCYTMAEYAKGETVDGKDIGAFSVEKLNKDSNYLEVYQKTVEQWWNEFGKGYIQEEQEVFDRIRERADIL